MNQDQINSYLRTFSTLVGGILVTSGYLTSDQAGVLTSGVLGLGGLAFLGFSLYGSYKAHSTAGKMASVAAVPGTIVVTTPAIAAATPEVNVVSSTENKVVPAATVAQ